MDYSSAKWKFVKAFINITITTIVVIVLIGFIAGIVTIPAEYTERAKWFFSVFKNYLIAAVGTLLGLCVIAPLLISICQIADNSEKPAPEEEE